MQVRTERDFGCDQDPAGASYLACRGLLEDQRPSAVEPTEPGIIVTGGCSRASPGQCTVSVISNIGAHLATKRPIR
jgi:hypothetical protein